MSPTFLCNRPAVASSVAVMRSAARAYALEVGAPEETVDDVQLAVSEAVTNAVLHAYPGEGEPGPVSVEGCVEEGELCVDVCDQGAGITPRPDSPGAGVGLTLISRLAGRLRIDTNRSGRGTCLRMRFALPSA